MAYLILSALLLAWFFLIKIYGKLSWHSVFIVVFISLIITDIPDIILSYILRLFSLHLNLFADPAVDMRNPILISDLLILPLMTIIFCYYLARYKHWWIAVAFPIALSLLEYIFVRLGYMEYHHIHPVFTLVIYTLYAIFFYYLADRLIDYSPPIADNVAIMPAAYVIMAFPGTILGTVLNFFLFRPGLFLDFIADNWVVAISMGMVSGLIAGVGFSIFRSKLGRVMVITFIGLTDIIINFTLLAKGMLVYLHWSSVYHVLMMVSSTLLLLVYFWWEIKYRESLRPN